jgi:hypothetical protein
MTSFHVGTLESRTLLSSVLDSTGFDGSGNLVDTDLQPLGTPTIGAVKTLVTGDFNGDGNVDVLARTAGDAGVRLYLGHGDGRFSPPGPGIGAGMNPSSLVAADFNHDGNLDFAAANNPGPFLTVMSTVTIRLGNGDGTFGKTASPFGGQYPTALAVADVNHDRAPDLIVANEGMWSPPLTLQPPTYGAGVLLGVGDGTFQMVRKIFLDNPQNCVAAGDVNGDGKADAVLGGPLQQAAFASPLPMTRLWAAIGDGSGAFAVTASAPFPGRMGGVATGDFNGDHRDDVAALQLMAPATNASLQGDATVRTLLSNGDGTFTAKAAQPTRVTRAVGISIADMNDDHNLDFVVAGTAAFNTPSPTLASLGTVAIVPGTGGGALGTPILLRTGPGPLCQAIADVNGDNRPDIITGGVTGISVILNRPKATTAADLLGASATDVLLE